MRKVILSIFIIVLGLPLVSRNVNAQTGPDCEMIRARASYKCLTGWTDCFYPCTDKTKDVSACYNTCKQAENECNKKVDADFRVCKTAITETVKFVTKNVDELIPGSNQEKFTPALVDGAPKETDWSFLPQFDPSRVPTAEKAPEITGEQFPYRFKDSKTGEERKYYSFTAEAGNHIVEFQSGAGITLEMPSGQIFKPQKGDYVRVPLGTRISTESFYFAGREYDASDYTKSTIGVTNLAGGSSLTLGGSTIVKLLDGGEGWSSILNVHKGKVRFNSGGFGGSDQPSLPPAIEFEGREGVKLTWEKTDFSVAHDPNKGLIAAEIYDGTIKLLAGEEARELSSSYGSEIKRIEVDGEGKVRGRIALPGMKTNWWKLAVAGGILLGLIGGVVMLIKRKRMDKKRKL